MRIQNNMTAMNAHRNYGINNSAISKNVEKLSSGYRINRAGDDAAGLAISEKMRAQIRGLTMASKNAQDGVSLIQTAEGGLQSAHNVLQRMRELSVQAGNDTNESLDRDQIQKEVNELTKELDRIGHTTEFNKKTLLDGSLAAAPTGAKGVAASGGLPTGVTNLYDTSAVPGATVSLSLTGGVKGQTTISFTASGAASSTETLTIGIDGVDYANTVGLADSNDTTKIATNIYDALINNVDFTDKFTVVNNGTTLTVTAKEAGVANAMVLNQTAAGAGAGGLAATGGTTTVGSDASGATDMGDGWWQSGTTNFRWDGLTDVSTTVGLIDPSRNELSLQVGANDGQDQVVKVSIKGISTDILGLTKGLTTNKTNSPSDADITNTTLLNMSSNESAQAALVKIDTALNSVSDQRAKLGAVQNRLEYTIGNLDTGAENLQAAESRIRDVDMAKEMTQFSKNNILGQASTAMLAQANSLPQSVLQLLG